MLQSDWWTAVLVRCSLDLCYKVTDEPLFLVGVAWTGVTKCLVNPVLVRCSLDLCYKVTGEPLSLIGVAWTGVTK